MLRHAIWLFLPLGWALACGGRFAQITDEGDDAPGGGSAPTSGAATTTGGSSTTTGGSATAKAGRSSRGGSTGKAGGSSRGGSTSRAGSPSVGGGIAVGGAVSTAGTFGIAGTFTEGGACACDAIACEPPLRYVPNPDGCCYHCEVDFVACQQAQNEYRQFRAQIEDKYGSFGCNTAADCTLFWDKNECGAASCGVPMPIAAVQQLSQNLNSYAAGSCSFACPQQPEPPCGVAPGGPACIMNRCVQ